MADCKHNSSRSSQLKNKVCYDSFDFLSRVQKRKRSQPLSSGIDFNVSDFTSLQSCEKRPFSFTKDEQIAAHTLVLLSRGKRAKLDHKNDYDDEDPIRLSLPPKSINDDAKIPLFSPRIKTELNPRYNDGDDEDPIGLLTLPPKSVNFDAKIPLFLPRIKTEQNPSNSDFWFIKKVLKNSDVGGHNRLMLGTKLVMKNILSTIKPDMAKNCATPTGQEFEVYDVDCRTTYNLVFRRHTSSKCFVLNGEWGKIVRIRELIKGDEIGLAWDDKECRFLFKILNWFPNR